jgi:hypothetical protein
MGLTVPHSPCNYCMPKSLTFQPKVKNFSSEDFFTFLVRMTGLASQTQKQNTQADCIGS